MPALSRIYHFACSRRPATWAFLAFLVLYIIALQAARSSCSRDPSSFFFQPYKAHTPAYSTVRRHESEHFILQATLSPQLKVGNASTPEFCVGIASVARHGTRYFRTAVGSILDGLHETERAQIHLVLFIAQTDPTQHPAYAEGWMENVADTVLTYDLSEETMTQVRQWENDAGLFRQKGLFDYTYLLKACSKIGAKYAVLLEDDLVALDGWYHRTRAALRVAEEKTKQAGEDSFLYLRLFYTEQFLGWNSEEWPIYLLGSFCLTTAVALVLLAVRLRYPRTRGIISQSLVLLVCFLCTPMCIGLFFMAGRTCMFPMSPGVHEMPKFGCCSQGFVFQKGLLPDLISYYESSEVGFVDMLTEQYADRNGKMRWAVAPSVLQHVGAQSSKEGVEKDRDGFSVSETIWNFGFEMNEKRKLEEEHIRVIHKGHFRLVS